MRATMNFNRFRESALLAALALVVLALIVVAQTRSERASAQTVATPLEVVQYVAPKLSVSLVQQGIRLSWAFEPNVEPPSGWQLAGYTLGRWIEGQAGSLKFFSLDPVKAQEYIDTLDDTSMEQRVPGYQYSYLVYAYYHRLSDGAEQVGKSSELVYRLPELPKVVDPIIFKVNRQFSPPYRASWYAPNLSWDANVNPGPATHYLFYRDGTRYHRATSSSTLSSDGANYIWMDDDAATAEYSIRVQYGKFFSSLTIFPVGG